MKQVFAFVVFLAVSAWSNIFSIDAGISFEKGYLDIDTTKTCNVDTSYINCGFSILLDIGYCCCSVLYASYCKSFCLCLAIESEYAFLDGNIAL